MTKSPLLNAFLATGYINVVVLMIWYGGQYAHDKPDTILIPVGVLSLFVLSAALMGWIFMLQPIQMYLDGQKKEGVNLFLRTVAIFACVTVVIFGILFLLIPTL